jgi:hypothetical protein
MSRWISYPSTRYLAIPLILALAPIPSFSATATELFISEYIKGTSNNKALEIYNGTGAAVNLATGGYNIQMFFNGSTTAGLTINLTGTVVDGDGYVVANSAAAATILAQADQTNSVGGTPATMRWCSARTRRSSPHRPSKPALARRPQTFERSGSENHNHTSLRQGPRTRAHFSAVDARRR